MNVVSFSLHIYVDLLTPKYVLISVLSEQFLFSASEILIDKIGNGSGKNSIKFHKINLLD